jgi:hypothetical protein
MDSPDKNSSLLFLSFFLSQPDLDFCLVVFAVPSWWAYQIPVKAAARGDVGMSNTGTASL